MVPALAAFALSKVELETTMRAVPGPASVRRSEAPSAIELPRVRVWDSSAESLYLDWIPAEFTPDAIAVTLLTVEPVEPANPSDSIPSAFMPRAWTRPFRTVQDS